jgi:two-component system, NarL family, sensor histidine kinase UhpB
MPRSDADVTRLRARLPRRPEAEAAVAAAAAKAALLVESVDDPAQAAALRAYTLTGATIGGLAPARDWRPEEISAFVDEIAGELGVDAATARHELFRRALESIEEARLPGRLALRAVLTTLRGFAPLGEASVWTSGAAGPVQCLAIVGAETPSRRVRAAARETVSTGRDRIQERGLVSSIALSRWDRPVGALVIRARPANRPRAIALATEAARALVGGLENVALFTRNAQREQALVESSERRLCRLGYDIHDGPIQEIAMLAADVRLLRRQIGRGLLAAARGVLVGRLDDFEARMTAIDRELRDLALSLDRSSAADAPLGEVLRRQVAASVARGTLAVELDVRETEDMTASQRLALIALVREGLANAREHGAATEVRIRVAPDRRGTVATIEDNGRGLDVERSLARAARRGRLGLIGLGERVRLLGGSLEVDSRPGGPTRLTVQLPRWEGEGAQRPLRVA